MSKKDNLLKFWESLESNQQTKDVLKPYKPQSQSLKIKSKSQIDLLCPRPSIVPSKAQLQGWRGVTGSKHTITTPGVNDHHVDGDNRLAESEMPEVGLLPVIPRNDILSHTTKSRARRSRTHPARQKKMTDQVLIILLDVVIDFFIFRFLVFNLPLVWMCRCLPTPTRHLQQQLTSSQASSILQPLGQFPG